MLKNYAELVDELNLTETYKDEQQLKGLVQWCEQHCIEHFPLSASATPEENYKLLCSSAKTYLDTFIPLSEQLNTPNIKLQKATPIQYAVRMGYVDFLKTHKDNVDPTSGRTPLHFAAISGKLPIVKILVAENAQICADKMKKYPTHLALGKTLADQSKSVEEQNTTRTEIYRLIRDKAPQYINEQDQDKNNVAHYMAMYGFNELLEELITQESSLLLDSNRKSLTPAHQAILQGQLSCLKTLLKDERVKNLSTKDGNLLDYAEGLNKSVAVAACKEAGISPSHAHHGSALRS